jgi:hydroxymethylpyrimidine pyrophosphatase-like HAD family hydrolase
MMGGGPDAPSKQCSGEQQLVLCTLPWPKENAAKSVDALKEEFPDLEVEYFYTQHLNGKIKPLEISKGTS